MKDNTKSETMKWLEGIRKSQRGLNLPDNPTPVETPMQDDNRVKPLSADLEQYIINRYRRDPCNETINELANEVGRTPEAIYRRVNTTRKNQLVEILDTQLNVLNGVSTHCNEYGRPHHNQGLYHLPEKTLESILKLVK